MRTQISRFVRSGAKWAALILISNQALAGVFTLPSYIEPKRFSFGVEPELVLTDGAGVGGNARLQIGLNTLQNANFFVGGGSGPVGFRAGANLAFDLFEDTEEQPGAGIAVQVAHRSLTTHNRFEIQGIPYMSKSVPTGIGLLAPFVAVPVGIGFWNGVYQAVSSLNVGLSLKPTPRFRYIVEMAFGFKNEPTTLSGGIVYYP